MIKRFLGAVVLALLCAAPAAAQEAELSASAITYGARLEGFAYPHEVKNFALPSQGQTLEMAYMDVPPPDVANGQVAVLLHGKNFCGATWEGTIDVLHGAGYRVIVPDQIGFCKSDKPQNYQYSLNQLALNTHELLRSLGVDKAVVIGHSMGGMLAMRYALSYPAAVEKIVLVNPIGLEDWQQKGVPYAAIDALYEGELKTSFESIKNYQLKFYYNGMWKPEYDRWVEMQAGLYAGAGRDIVALSQARTSDMIFTQPVVHDMPHIRVPAVLMIGGLDRTAPGANRAPAEIAAKLGLYPELSRAAQQAIKGSILVDMPSLGHSPQVEAPEMFHKALLENLR